MKKYLAVLVCLMGVNAGAQPLSDEALESQKDVTCPEGSSLIKSCVKIDNEGDPVLSINLRAAIICKDNSSGDLKFFLNGQSTAADMPAGKVIETRNASGVVYSQSVGGVTYVTDVSNNLESQRLSIVVASGNLEIPLQCK